MLVKEGDSRQSRQRSVALLVQQPIKEREKAQLEIPGWKGGEVCRARKPDFARARARETYPQQLEKQANDALNVRLDCDSASIHPCERGVRFRSAVIGYPVDRDQDLPYIAWPAQNFYPRVSSKNIASSIFERPDFFPFSLLFLQIYDSLDFFWFDRFSRGID